ncbi:general secretion pathway protein GspB [Methylomonas sp. MgM2]
MSYILNALRKSERERQAVEPDAVINRISVSHVSRYRSPKSLVVTLIVTNVAMLMYFLGFIQNNTAISPDVTLPQAKVKASIENQAPVTVPAHTGKNDLVSMKEPDNRSGKVINPLPAKPKTAATVYKEKASAAQKPPTKRESPTDLEEAASSDKPKADSGIKNKPTLTNAKIDHTQSTRQGEGTELAQPEVELEDTAKHPIEKTDVMPARPSLAFLDELPYEFQRELPNLTINVFSYSDAVAERFVMIDMVRYVPGQRIKDVLTFKEIRPDGIVVDYKGRTFIIRRP